MRIGLNLLPVVPGIGGAWHYIANLISALAQSDRQNEYVAFVTGASASLVPVQDNFTSVHLPIHAEWRALRIGFENSVLPMLTRTRRLDCMHHFFGTLPILGSEPSIVSVFDLMVFARPSDFSPTKRAYLQWMRRRAAKHASLLAPMSRTTAESLSDWLAVPGDRMTVVSTAIGPQFHPRTESEVREFRARHALNGEFWLCVSGVLPHKNIPRLIEAFAQLRRMAPDGWSLVIRGGRSGETDRLVAAHALESHVQFLPWLHDNEMPLLYSSASALIFPSLFEGGGLPVMEAMSSGCPVVASNLPTTREFAQDAALTFEPTDVHDITRAMHECEESPALRQRLSRSGQQRASQFSPRTVAASCIDAYRRAVPLPG
ncbi:MAG: group 1 glycosyl transferase [Gemmatimonadetes bacterium]|nr:group 1 glycosyl transferase [Gemmatimonadota bacterium]